MSETTTGDTRPIMGPEATDVPINDGDSTANGTEKPQETTPEATEPPAPKRNRNRKTAPEKLTMTPTEVYEAVTARVKDGQSVKDAAAEVAEKTGRSVGSISQTYYNAKRKAGGGSAPTARRGRSRMTGTPTADSLAGLARQVAEMEAELRELRAFKAEFAALLKR